jgi:hypothetical protein
MFSPKNLAKILAFLLKLQLVFAKKIDQNIVFFEKNANCFEENWQNRRKL